MVTSHAWQVNLSACMFPYGTETFVTRNGLIVVGSGDGKGDWKCGFLRLRPALQEQVKSVEWMYVMVNY